MYCQLVYICGCIPARIQRALADLPETLDETYERSLREINKADWEFAHRLFQFVAVASRPLLVEELADLLAFDFTAGQIPEFHEGWRLEDPVDAVLSTCSSLLAIVNGGYEYQLFFKTGKIIQFSHFSVKEFLTSTRLASAADIILRRYHVPITPAHSLAAQTCLGILLHLDNDADVNDSLEKWPIAEYAAYNWIDHAQFEGVSQNVEDGMKQLFDPRKPHLAVCVWIRDIRRRWDRRPSDSPNYLHYAALWGFHSMVEFLVTEHSQDVQSQRFADNVTPLHLASDRGHVKTVRSLIEHGAGVAIQDEHRATPLHRAAQNGHVEVTRVLIECGADVTAQDKDKETPSHLASQGGHVEVARILIDNCADVTAQNNDGDTPLHLAGQAEIARMLIERGADVAAQNKDRNTPLHQALSLDRVEVARILIECGADVTAQRKGRETPLHLASQRGHVGVAHALIECGADIRAQDKGRATALHLASLSGQVEVARMLIEHGAVVAARNKDGQAPLHLASQMGQVEVARILIECGANVTARNKKGETPLHLSSLYQPEIDEPPEYGAAVTRMLQALEHGEDVTPQVEDVKTTLQLTKSAEMARLLIEHGADVMAKDKDGETPLHLALKEEEDGVARMLIELGADVTAQNNNGETPLHSARNVEIARMLFEHGADVAAQTTDMETPLHQVSSLGQVEVARMLIENGADVMAQTEDGDTPLHQASSLGQVEVARMLIEHGADFMAQTDDGDTPLHLVSTPDLFLFHSVDNIAEVARMLLENGADVNARNKYGLTPFCLASRGGLEDVTDVLLEYGADDVYD